MSERLLNAMLRPIRQRLAMMAARAVVRLVDDSQPRQLLQIEVLKGELRNHVERMQNYGFKSFPLDGSDTVVLSVGGQREQCIALIVDDRRYKINLVKGEVAMHTDEGDYIHLKRERNIEISAGTKLTIISPMVEMSQDLHVLGSITCDNNVSDANGSMQEMRDDYNGHGHSPDASDPPDPQME